VTVADPSMLAADRAFSARASLQHAALSASTSSSLETSPSRSWRLLLVAAFGAVVYLGYVSLGLALGFSYVRDAAEKLATLPRAQGTELRGGAALVASLPLPLTERVPQINPLELFPRGEAPNGSTSFSWASTRAPTSEQQGSRRAQTP
jgi:hypothetical protein